MVRYRLREEPVQPLLTTKSLSTCYRRRSLGSGRFRHMADPAAS
jgi:hypothetical protein